MWIDGEVRHERKHVARSTFYPRKNVTEERFQQLIRPTGPVCQQLEKEYQRFTPCCLPRKSTKLGFAGSRTAVTAQNPFGRGDDFHQVYSGEIFLERQMHECEFVQPAWQ